MHTYLLNQKRRINKQSPPKHHLFRRTQPRETRLLIDTVCLNRKGFRLSKNLSMTVKSSPEKDQKMGSPPILTKSWKKVEKYQTWVFQDSIRSENRRETAKAKGKALSAASDPRSKEKKKKKEFKQELRERRKKRADGMPLREGLGTRRRRRRGPVLFELFL